jgi:hypothetical protein
VKIFAKPTQPLALRDWIGIFLITAFISVLFALMFKNIPKANEQLIVYMGDTAKTENTGKLADAMKAVAQGVSSGSDAGKAAGEVADAAAEKAGEIQEERP